MDDVLLNETRREILTDYDKENSTHRSRKSRLKKSTDTVLGELIEIAQSPEIDNTDFFDPESVATLVYWLGNDPHHVDATAPAEGGQVPGGLMEFSDELETYRTRLYFEIDGKLRHFHRPESAPHD